MGVGTSCPNICFSRADRSSRVRDAGSDRIGTWKAGSDGDGSYIFGEEEIGESGGVTGSRAVFWTEEVSVVSWETFVIVESVLTDPFISQYARPNFFLITFSPIKPNSVLDVLQRLPRNAYLFPLQFFNFLSS